MTTTAEPESTPAVSAQFRTVRTEKIHPCATNPRRSIDPADLAELTDSVRKLGVLQPLLVRPAPSRVPDTYELVAGHRRHAAAKAAGLEYVPVTVRELTDVEVLEIQLVENLQRADLHPLEEAEGYRRLTAIAKMSVARIAERIGRAPQYVYDRLKLNALTKDAKKLFLEDRFTLGHAILLARLKPEAQERALDPENEALFTLERTLWTPEEDASENNFASRSQREFEDPVKPRSVKELAGWIDEHVKFDTQAADVPDLFPETAATLDRARETAEKVIPITWDYHVQVDARDGNRVFGPRSWKKAVEKPCDQAITGVIVVGPGRGTAFKVCVAKEKCKVHWASEQRARAKQAKARAEGGQESEKFKAAEERERQKREREEIDQKRWEKAAPAIREALAGAVATARADAKGALADLLCAEIGERRRYGAKAKDDGPTRGVTAEDLVRFLAWHAVLETIDYPWGAGTNWPPLGKALGVDVVKIRDEVAPADEKVQAKPRKRGTKKSKG